MESGRTDSADDECIEEFSPIKVPFIHECAREYLTNHSVLTIIDQGMSVELSEGEEEMKWMIASDIHGSAAYLEKLLEAYKQEKADRMLLLGDLLYHGPRNDLPKGYAPKEVIRMLNEVKEELLCVRGNCEADVDQMVLEFPVMADYCVLQLEDTGVVFASHGHVHNPQCMPPLKNGDILLNGHTHVPACEKIADENGNEYMYLNPGSVSIPKEGSSHSYMVYEKGTFTWKNMSGEVYREWKKDSRF